jgi:hypothetical protein
MPAIARPIKPDAKHVRGFIESLFEEDLHAKRVLSLANGVVGAIEAAALGVHAIGHGLADVDFLDPKHAIKQVDRLLSNSGVDVEALQVAWVAFVVGQRDELVVAIDWTEFDKDDQATIALHLITSHGRATPLLWKTVRKSRLCNRRNAHEDTLLLRLREMLPLGTKVTVLADRAFGDRELYVGLGDIGFDYVIRFRGCIHVTSEDEETRTAAQWVPDNGRPKRLRNALVTQEKTPIGAVVCVDAPGMKEPWCLAASSSELSASAIVKLYGRRFTIEESFRDTKDPRFGFGLAATRISSPERRDRLLLIGALAQGLLTLLGAAGEAAGLDRHLKANTSKKRVYSLFRQGLIWYRLIPGLKEERLRVLMNAFGSQLAQHAVFREIYALI